MTTGELIQLLETYPHDTPIVDGKGYDLRWKDIGERTIDTIIGTDEQGEPEYSIGKAVSIGRRF